MTADSLILSLDEVRRIANYPGLASRLALDIRQPRSDHTHDSQFPTQCRAVFDQDVEFGRDWKQFRSVDYSGSSNYGVTQAVGVYQDDGAARAAFDRVASAATACSELHVEYFQFTVDQQDRSTVALCSNQCSQFYRVKSSVLIDVAAPNFPDSERIARTVLQTISDRIATT